jgi:GT2 family glycosyltransferase
MTLVDNTSLIIVTYNSEDHIEDCLNSIINLSNPEIIVVDNISTDKTVQIIESKYPQVKLVKNPINSGFGAGNNIGVNNSQNKYLVFLNPDAKINSDTIHHILKPLENDDKLVTVPKILLSNGKKINTCGNKQHITGMAFTNGIDDNPDNFNQYQYLNGVSGACFAITRAKFLELGGFDENIFLYMEDTELSWRMNSRGLKILYVPDATVYHDYVFSITPNKIYHVERGRYIILRKYLSFKEYLIFSPSLIMTEILTWGYSILSGPKGVKNKLRATKDGLTINVKKEKSNKELFKKLDVNIPDLNFRFKGFFNIFRKIANFTYQANRRLIK